MSELEAALGQGLYLAALLEELSESATRAVARACAAVGLKPPKRVLLSLRRFEECRGEEGCRGVVCGYYDCEREEVVLSLPCAGGVEGLLRAVAHELVHRCQHVGGSLCRVHYDCNALRRVNTELPYGNRPHEAEAYWKEGEFIEVLRPLLEGPLGEILQALRITLEIRNAPPLKAHVLYVGPGGRGELRGHGFVAELAGRAKVNTPLLLYWPQGVFLEGEISLDLSRGFREDVYIVLGRGATDLYNALRDVYTLEKRGEVDEYRKTYWLMGIDPGQIRRYGEGRFEISLAEPPEDALAVVKVTVSEKTWPYYQFEKDLKSALEHRKFLEKLADIYISRIISGQGHEPERF